MWSEALDITIESRGRAVWLLLSGPFNSEQIPNMREKIRGIVDDGNLEVVIDMEKITEVNENAVSMFLGVLNYAKGKHGDILFVFKNPVVSEAFSQHRHIFSIFPDTKSLSSRGFVNTMRRRGILLSRKTGIRLSRPVAIFLLFILCGWFFTLALIIRNQNKLIQQQENEMNELTQWKGNAAIEIKNLRNSLEPLKQLGLVKDSLLK